jgi:hypothetical protein
VYVCRQLITEQPPNRRLQLTAFGARDHRHFDSFRSALAAAEAQHVGRHFDGTLSRSRTELMVMHSKVMVCWHDQKQPYRDEQRIRTPICAGVIKGNAIWSCPMHSNALLSRRGSSQTYRVRRNIRRSRRAK